MSENNPRPYDNVLQVVGWTPLIRLNSVNDGVPGTFYVKCEFMNPGGSVKDRIGLAMIEAAELDGIDSVVWYEAGAGGRATALRVRSLAAMEILAYLGGWWRLGLIIGVVPGVLRDLVYGWVARHRHHLSRGRPACVIPPGTGDRFIG